MFTYPELWSAKNYLHTVTPAELDFYNDRVLNLSYPCDEDIYTLCCTIMYDERMEISADSMHMIGVYIHLREIILTMLQN
jgi:hypothetical protein